jgi:hypothetical protein
MSNRPYLIVSAAVAAGAGLTVIASFAFGQVAANWIAFGLAVVALSGAAASVVATRRYRAVAGVIALLSAFTIVVSVGVFTGGAQHWIVFGNSVAVLTLSSLARERYVSGLIESQAVTRDPLRAAA